MKKHICKVCGRSFPNGRSLGGHMRTHVVLSSPMEDEDKPINRYGLRDHPKKLQRFDDTCLEKEKHMVHAQRAKVCSSSTNSSSKTCPRDKLNQEEDDDLCSEGSYEGKAEEMSSQYDREVSFISMSVRKRKRTSRKVTKISVCSAPLALSSEYDNDVVNGAVCLLMFSRGTHSITDLPDDMSRIIRHGKRVHSCPSEDEDQQFKKPKISSKKNKSHKKNKYMCTICDKSFSSYQALGGHITSHKKMKGANNELIYKDCESQTVGKSPENFECHKCSICGKTFPTGQALSGHKRSHLVEGNNFPSTFVVSATGSNGVHPQPALIETEQKVSKPNSIDLNLPAPTNDR